MYLHYEKRFNLPFLQQPFGLGDTPPLETLVAELNTLNEFG